MRALREVSQKLNLLKLTSPIISLWNVMRRTLVHTKQRQYARRYQLDFANSNYSQLPTVHLCTAESPSLRSTLMKDTLTSRTTMVIRSPKHRDAPDEIRGKPRRFHPSGLSPRLMLSSSFLSTQTDQECFGIPRFPFRLSLQLHGSSSPSPSPRPFVGTVYPPVLQLREGMLIWYAAGDP